jgi:N-methylhydantoinase A
MTLDYAAAYQAVTSVADKLGCTTEEAAAGILRIANEHMVQALRVISVQRGHDPRDFNLVSFGGAGGLHICELADALNMTHAIIPMHGGVLSAFGMLVAAPARELSHTLNRRCSECSDAEVNAAIAGLRVKGQQLMAAEMATGLRFRATLDVCYSGQSFNLAIDWSDLAQVAADFHELHEKRYGHRMSNELQLVNIRLHISAEQKPFELPVLAPAANPQQGLQHYVSLKMPDQKVPVYQREQLGAGQVISGPALILEPVATSYIAQGWLATVGHSGNLQLKKSG